MTRAFFCTLALSVLLACASAAAERGRLKAGSWGGPHIRLDVAEDGTAAVELDCAHGVIGTSAAPVALDSQGGFRAEGRYVREGPGPVREGADQEGVPARYAGKVAGGKLTLTITLEGSDEEIGAFELTYGRTPRLTKCM
jgi:hypothetical protein